MNLKQKTISLIVLTILSLSKLAIAQEQKPNILYILTDDQRYDSVKTFNKALDGREMSELGYIESPEVDKLASQGTTFVNTYCQAMGCAPSRASMHTGRYPFRSGIYEFEWHNNAAKHTRPSLPELMVDAGYQTFHVGKLGFRLKELLPNGKAKGLNPYQTSVYFKDLAEDGLTDWGKNWLKSIDGKKLEKPVKNAQFFVAPDGSKLYIAQDLEKQVKKYKGNAKLANKKYDLLKKYNEKFPKDVYKGMIIGGVSPQPAGKTRDGYYQHFLGEYLKSENSTFKAGSKTHKGIDLSKPVFAHIGFDFPHTPVLPPAEFRKRFQKHKYKVPEFSESELEGMPVQLKRFLKRNFTDSMTQKEKESMIRDYYAFCAYGDQLVGQAAKDFVSYSEKHNRPWMIVYVCGDHGWKLNEHGAVSKFTPWDWDSHNPMIVVSSNKKKFPAGKVVTDFTEFVDLAPTILSAAGENLKEEKYSHLDGIDMAKTVSKEAPIRDYVVGESHAVTGPRAYIRTKDYVLSLKTRPSRKEGENMRWALTASWEDLDASLYDCKKDPREINNVVFNKKYKAIAEKMKDKLLNIVLGDNRVEVDWQKWGTGTQTWHSNFAPGSHDYKLKL